MRERSVYDTRFFVEYFYSGDAGFLRRLKEDLRAVRERMVSALTIHEVYRVNLEREGREVAILRSETIRRDFNVVDVDYETAVRSAELRSKHRIPMADSVIAATAQIHGCPLVSDDTHFQQIPDLKTRWYTTR
ncbi:MAG TPA: type II toxin-antitoxin system VapC family toxin [Candidatus Bathyarchaeota archaeon]|nr:type II toxin-antitoxin system VapC family toxin [Candidatus Bathyarchaeota archaeon]